MVATWKKPLDIIEEKGYKPQDDSELENIIKQVLQENQQALNDIKEWKLKAAWFLVWQVMKKSQWKANPWKAKDMIIKIAQEI